PKRILDEGLHFFTPQTFAFVLYPFLASLGSIVLVCLIGTALFDAGVGLIAGVLVAVSPFDTAFASTMVIDLVTSFLTALAIYGVAVGARSGGRRGAMAYAVAAGALGVAYWVKEPVTLVLPGFLAILAVQVTSGTSPRGPLVCCATLALLAGFL